jgi:hypothetical protein
MKRPGSGDDPAGKRVKVAPTIVLEPDSAYSDINKILKSCFFEREKRKKDNI